MNAIPRVILAPLFIIWFGIGVGSKVGLSLILVAVLIFFAVYNGFREVDRRLVERVTTLGSGRKVLLREVYLPSVTSWVMSNLKVALGFAFTGTVVGECVSASRGLGYLMTFALSTYNTAQVVALVLRRGDPIGERLSRVAKEQNILLMMCDQCVLQRGLAAGKARHAIPTDTVDGVSVGCFPDLYAALAASPPDQVITL